MRSFAHAISAKLYQAPLLCEAPASLRGLPGPSGDDSDEARGTHHSEAQPRGRGVALSGRPRRSQGLTSRARRVGGLAPMGSCRVLVGLRWVHKQPNRRADTRIQPEPDDGILMSSGVLGLHLGLGAFGLQLQDLMAVGPEAGATCQVASA